MSSWVYWSKENERDVDGVGFKWLISLERFCGFARNNFWLARRASCGSGGAGRGMGRVRGESGVLWTPDFDMKTEKPDARAIQYWYDSYLYSLLHPPPIA